MVLNSIGALNVWFLSRTLIIFTHLGLCSHNFEQNLKLSRVKNLYYFDTYFQQPNIRHSKIFLAEILYAYTCEHDESRAIFFFCVHILLAKIQALTLMMFRSCWYFVRVLKWPCRTWESKKFFFFFQIKFFFSLNLMKLY